VFEVEVDTKDLDPREIAVELFANGIGDLPSTTNEMNRSEPPPSDPHRCVYRTTVLTSRPEDDYTARIVPRRPGVAVPLESGRILWQR
jgi:starch phosphorylase